MRMALICTEKLPVPPVRGGAIQTYIDGVLPFLRRRHEVTVVCVADPELPEREVTDGVRFVRVPRGDGPQAYCENVAVFLAGERWDLVEVFNRPAFARQVVAAAPGARFILSMHNEMFPPHRLPPDDARFCLEKAAAVVAVSDYIRRGIAELYPAYSHKLRTVRSGVDLDRFRPVWAEISRRAAVRGALGVGERPVVLAVTRLSVKKGIHVLLEAMQSVLSDMPDARLVVAGSRWYGADEEDDYVRQVREQARPLGDTVKMLGYVPYAQMPDIFLLGDLFVCPSQWQEPLARVHFEAMATGLPIITTDRGGNAEVIEEGGNGWLVRPHDSPHAFADAICGALADPAAREVTGRRGRALAEQRYGWARVAAELLEVLEGR